MNIVRKLLSALLLAVVCVPTAWTANIMEDKSIYPMMLGDGYLDVSVGGGISTLRYELMLGERSTGIGGKVNIGYNKFFSSHFGFTVGAGVSLYNAKTALDKTDKTQIIIPSYSNVDYVANYNTSYVGWEEKQSCIAADVPLGLMLRMPFSSGITFLASLGATVSFPLKTSYEVTSGKREITCDIPDLSLNINDLKWAHGIGTNNGHPSGKSETKTVSASLFFEVDITHRVANVNMYYGIYGSIGVANLTENNVGLTSEEGVYNGVLRSELCENVKPAAIGVKIGVKLPCPWMSVDDVNRAIKASQERTRQKLMNTHSKTEPKKSEGTGGSTLEAPTEDEETGIEETQTPQKTPQSKPTNTGNKKAPAKKSNSKAKPKKPAMYTGKKNQVKPKPAQSTTPTKQTKPAEDQTKPAVTPKTKALFDRALNGIQFGTGNSIIMASSYPILDEVVEVLKNNPDYKLVVKGHADNTGPNWSSNKTSRERAVAVAEYIISKGIDRSRVRSEGYGNTMPIDTNDTEEGRFRNRRVEFELEY